MCKKANASLLHSRYLQLHYSNNKFVKMKAFTGKKNAEGRRARPVVCFAYMQMLMPCFVTHWPNELWEWIDNKGNSQPSP